MIIEVNYEEHRWSLPGRSILPLSGRQGSGGPFPPQGVAIHTAGVEASGPGFLRQSPAQGRKELQGQSSRARFLVLVEHRAAVRARGQGLVLRGGHGRPQD